MKAAEAGLSGRAWGLEGDSKASSVFLALTQLLGPHLLRKLLSFPG